MSKQEILDRLKSSLLHNTHIPDFDPKYSSTMFIEKDLLDEFVTNVSNNKALVIQSSKDKLAQDINDILAQIQAKKVLYNLDIQVDSSLLKNAEFIPYEKSVDETRDELFSIDTSIVQARCGVANIGVIGLSSNSQAPRLSSLITNTCIYLLDKNNIVEHLYAGIEFIKGYEKEQRKSEVLPSNIIFVAGPSRTADIELQTVFGVHGPRVTYILLY